MPLLSFEHYERRRLERIAGLCRGGSVLDIGYAQYPNPYFQNLQRTGIDLNPSNGPTKYEEELVGDAMALKGSVGDRAFDNIVAAEFIEHVENPYEFLRSLKPFIAPGGRLIISTPNPVGWPCLLFEWLRSKRFYYTTHHVYYFAPRWVERMLDFAGYRVESVKSVGLLTPWINLPCPASLSYQVIFSAVPKSG